MSKLRNKKKEELFKNTHRMYHVLIKNGKNNTHTCGAKKENMHMCMRIGSARSITVNYRYQTSANTQTDRIAKMHVCLLFFFRCCFDCELLAWVSQKSELHRGHFSTFAFIEFLHTLVAFFLSLIHAHQTTPHIIHYLFTACV